MVVTPFAEDCADAAAAAATDELVPKAEVTVEEAMDAAGDNNGPCVCEIVDESNDPADVERNDIALDSAAARLLAKGITEDALTLAAAWLILFVATDAELDCPRLRVNSRE